MSQDKSNATTTTPLRPTLAPSSVDPEADEIEAELREHEGEIEDRSSAMGQLRGEYAFNANKLKESYYPRALPLLKSVHVNGYYRQRLEREIAWLGQKVIAMEQHKGGFFELRDLAQAKKALLDSLHPKFEEAFQQLERVTKTELAVLRNYENPPPIVLATVLTVMKIRGEEDAVVNWEQARILLSETYYYSFFTCKCRNHTKPGQIGEQPTPEHLAALEEYVLDPETSGENVSRASVPGGGMSLWLHALTVYYHVTAMTTPTKQTLEETREQLLRKRMALEEKKEEVSDASAKLDLLNKELATELEDLRQRYDVHMEPLQDMFFTANQKFNDVFSSPKRRAHDGSSLSPNYSPSSK